MCGRTPYPPHPPQSPFQVSEEKAAKGVLPVLRRGERGPGAPAPVPAPRVPQTSEPQRVRVRPCGASHRMRDGCIHRTCRPGATSFIPHISCLRVALPGVVAECAPAPPASDRPPRPVRPRPQGPAGGEASTSKVRPISLADAFACFSACPACVLVCVCVSVCACVCAALAL
jgi:hypothetical protein